jgi:hypothetical protein
MADVSYLRHNVQQIADNKNEDGSIRHNYLNYLDNDEACNQTVGIISTEMRGLAIRQCV